MRNKIALKLTLKIFAVTVLGCAAFLIDADGSRAAANTCPPEVYDNCWIAGTLYAVDPATCQCYCPNSSAVCNGPGNPYGGIDPTTCTCATTFDACNDQTTINACIMGGGSWNSVLCKCDFF